MTTFNLDETTPFGRHVAKRLGEERIIWLTTVSQEGIPQPRPVWFLWHAGTILIFSRPDGWKIQHIQSNPSVALNFDGDGQGGDIVVFLGKAAILNAGVPDEAFDRYKHKYEQGFRRLQMTPEEFAQSYAVAIQVKVEKLRGH